VAVRWTFSYLVNIDAARLVTPEIAWRRDPEQAPDHARRRASTKT
jgi:hypothetical protein